MEYDNKIVTKLNEFFKYDFHVILLKHNSKEPLTKWKEEKNWIKDVSQIDQNCNIGIICDKIIVFDADTAEAIEFLEQFVEFRETTQVRTRKGKHYYFLKSESFTAKTEKVYKDSIKIDIKADNSYVVAPPSKIDNHEYVFEKDLSQIKTLTFDEYETLVYKIKDKLNLHEKTEHKKEPLHTTEIDIEQLKKIILQRYEEGHRQNIIMYMSGWLRKEGISRETVEQIVTEICFEAKDKDIKQRLSAVEQAWKKEPDELKGISGLTELGYLEQDLRDCLSKSKLKPLGNSFYTDGIFVYFVKETKHGTVLEMIGPWFTLKSKLFDGSNILYEIEYHGRTEIMKEIKDLETIRKITGKAIINEKKFLEFLNYETVKEIPKKYIRTETGWDDGIFYHPDIQRDDIWKNIIVDKKSHKKQNTEKQHEFIQKALLEGKKLAVAYVFSLASLLNEPLSTTPACLIISGKAGAGKTTMATLACNMFYDAERFNLSLNTTQNALEIIMKQLKDITIMVDEAALKNIDLEKIVFMVSERAGRARATRNLTVTLNNLCSNLILTSELDETSEFKRAGASRRVINLYIANKNEVSDLDIHKNLNCTGAGLDIALFLQDFIKTDEWNKIVEKEKEVSKYVKNLFNVALQMLVSVRVFEKYYNIELQHVYKKICDLLLETETKLYEKSNNIQRFIDEFSQFVVKNYSKFIDKRTNTEPKGDIYGQINSDNDFYVLSKIFDVFCNENQFHKKILLEELSREGIIHPSTSGLRKTAKISGHAVSVYHITLPN
ncbi:MAG: bifunctional DNA primase/polymerase [Candidatus Aenigmatarchaeota archaeon]